MDGMGFLFGAIVGLATSEVDPPPFVVNILNIPEFQTIDLNKNIDTPNIKV